MKTFKLEKLIRVDAPEAVSYEDIMNQLRNQFPGFMIHPVQVVEQEVSDLVKN